VRLDGALPVFEAGCEKSLGGRASGVGHTDVHSAEFCGDSLDETVDGGSVGDVAGLGEDSHAVLLSDFVGGGLECLIVAGAHGDAATFGGKGFGGAAADSLTGSGDQSDAIFQT